MATTDQQKAADAAFQFQAAVDRQAAIGTLRRKLIVSLLMQARKIEDKPLAQRFFHMRGHCSMMLEALAKERDLLHNTDIVKSTSLELSGFLTDMQQLQARFDRFAGLYTAMKAKTLPLVKAKAEQFDRKFVTWLQKDVIAVNAFDAQFQRVNDALEQAI